jgi:Skp family chaperone for outer membrane proteins
MKNARWALAILGALLVAGSSAQAQAPAPAPLVNGRIGFVDLQRIAIRSAAGVAARDQLEREKAKMQRDMEARQAEFDKLREELEKKGPLMTAETRREKEDQLDRKRREAARLADDYQRELTRKGQLVQQRVIREISGVLEKIAKQRGYYLVLERHGGVLFGAPAADLTDEIIRAYDEETLTKGKK